MTEREVYFSYHYKNDAARAQQIRDIGYILGNPMTPPEEWELLKSKGDAAVKKWIDDNMKYRTCVIVLIGEETASRKWVQYEIARAWNGGKGMFGIYIHNLKNAQGETCRKGPNPFETVSLKNGKKLSNFIDCYDPAPQDAYKEIKTYTGLWIAKSILSREEIGG